MGVDHLNGGALDRFARRQARTERANPLVSAAIGQGGMRVHGGGKITVENGGMDITGASVISGSQTISGTETITGSETINGSLQVNGPAEINGSFDVYSSSAFFQAGVTLLGGTYIGAGTTTNPVNARLDTIGGLVQRVTSSARYKVDAQKMVLDPALLDVPVVWWIDRGAAETIGELWDAPRPFTRGQQMRWDSATFRRVPGVIADAVVAAGGEAFVDRDEAGEIESFAYDRYTLARTEILADRLAAALARIEVLEQALTSR